MQRIITYIMYAIIITFLLISCTHKTTLQGYYVDKQETKNFITQDLPLSLIKMDVSNFDQEQKEAYNSVKKLNFLGYKYNQADIETFNVELSKVKTILNDNKYKDLMEFSDKGNKVVIKYIGDDTDADEIIVFGSANEKGFGIVRILGNNMNPDKLITLMGSIKNADFDNKSIQNALDFFNSEYP